MGTILVDPRRQIDAIDPNIYGNFIEHLRALYLRRYL